VASDAPHAALSRGVKVRMCDVSKMALLSHIPCFHYFAKTSFNASEGSLMVSVVSEWGMAGVEALRQQVSVLVIVDVLSFSTAVDVAVSRGAVVYPFPYGEGDAAQVAANRVGAILAKPRRASGGQFSLSPVSLREVPEGTKLMLPSPNGSRLSLACEPTPVLTGCLRNAAAVAERARLIAGDGMVGVIPAGELWPDGGLRPAIEDLLGAGAIIHHLELPCSPEAQVARDAYRAARDVIAGLIRASVSGRQLADSGFPADVEMALEQNVSNRAPRLTQGAYRQD
jgi:2-phosphosulfolactate phosphatase